MEVKYRKQFLKELKNLKNQEIYHKIYEIVFEVMPKA
jgi:mRNA-degrading endonuclease YafQ of YafQ-DinJ toxin-antitoxin module